MKSSVEFKTGNYSASENLSKTDINATDSQILLKILFFSKFIEINNL